MNKQLELFLHHCSLAFISKGKTFYSAPLGRYFPDCQRYADGAEVKRSDDTELFLMIEVDKNGAIAAEIFTLESGPLDRAEFSLTNATIPNIESFVMTANKNLDKPYKAPKSTDVEGGRSPQELAA